MGLMPVTRYRPIKVSDGEGGSTETLADEGSLTLWAELSFHDDQVLLTNVDRNEDIRVGDIISVVENG